MPTYEYKCPLCNHTEELMHKMSEDLSPPCPRCVHVAMQKRPGGGCGVIFTGSGFYETDYKVNK